MRFDATKGINHGQEKIVTYYAVLPEKIGNEVRWLEEVTIRKRYVKQETTKLICGRVVTVDTSHWENVEFIDKK